MKDIEMNLNEKIYRFKKNANIFNIVIIIFTLLFTITFLNNFFKHEVNFFTFLYFVIAVILVIIRITYKRKVFKSIKEELFIKILPSLFENNKLIYNEIGIPKSEFINSRIYRNFTDFYTSDGIKELSRDLYVANVTAMRKEENRKTTVFKGIFGYMKTKEFYENEIIIKPDIENKYVKNVLDEKGKILGDNVNVIRLENNEFERNFEVYSKDQIKARQLITPVYMEDLVKIKNEINAPIKIVYLGDKKYVAIWNMRIIDEKDILKNGVNIDSIKERIEKIFEIFDKC